MFLAEEAREMGLVNKVVALDELQAYATQQAAKLVALPASSIRMTKRLMKHNQVVVETQMAEEAQHFRTMLSAPEAKEAFTAFFEKRKPDFTKFA